MPHHWCIPYCGLTPNMDQAVIYFAKAILPDSYAACPSMRRPLIPSIAVVGNESPISINFLFFGARKPKILYKCLHRIRQEYRD